MRILGNPFKTGVLFLFLSAASAAFAQEPTGSAVGNAYDSSGAVVPGVQVSLRNSQTGETKNTTTNADGYYEFLLLRPATYEVTGEAKGFQRLHHGSIVVNVGAVARVDLHLEVGEVSQIVEVTTVIPLIEPDKVSISRAVDVKALSNLPMLGRQILDLALTAPGTIPGAPGTQVSAFSVAGMRTQSNNYTLDGISNNDPQVNGPLNAFHLTDAIQEFNVQTSIAGTDVGRNSGAQVNIITKSGANNIHGSTFYTGRNDALDANDFFLNKARQRKNPLHRHQFGGTIGGPIIHNRTFWFFSYEGFRESLGFPVTARVPTVAERAAVTNPVSLRILGFFPAPNTPFQGGSNWTGTTASTNDNNTYFWRGDHNLTANHHLTARYAWFHGNTDQLQSTARPFHGNITNTPAQHSALLQETWATAKIVNQARLGYSRNKTFFEPQDVSLNPASIFTDASGNPLPGYIDTTKDSLDGGLPNITITGFSGLGAGTNMPQGRATNTMEAIDDLSLVGPWGWTRHTLRFGGSLRYEQTNRMLNGNYRGQISFQCFNSVNLSATDPKAQAPCTRSFASGQPQRGSLRTGEGGTFRTWTREVWSYYAQDSFKPKSNLTINYGFRWENLGQLREKLNRGSNFVPGVGMMVLGSNMRIDVDPTKVGRAAIILTPVSTFLPRSGQKGGDYNNYAPFLGMAWSPRVLPRVFGNNKTVIRTGFRVSYDDVFANIPVNMGLNFPPVLTTTLPTATYNWGTVLNQNRLLFSADGTVPGGQRGIMSFNAWDYNARTAYAMNYALEIERQFGSDYALELSYVGSQGRKLGVFLDANEPTVTAVNDPTRRGDQTPNQRTFPFLQYAGTFQGAFGSNSTYNGMVATLRKRASHGLSYTASYTFAKSIDGNSSFFGSDGESGAFADPRNPAADRARSAFDVRHRVVGTYIYELPFGPGRRWGSSLHGPLGQVIGGWDVSGIVQYRSGFPFTLFAGTSFDYSGLNQFADRPNFAPGVSDIALNFDNPDDVYGCHSGFSGSGATATTNCPIFAQPKPGSIGNVGRNRFEGPTYTNVDFGVMKNFPFGEGRRVQFRAEFFNFFNKTNFKLPISNIQFTRQATCVPASSSCTTFIVAPSSSTIGTIQGAQDQRLIQLGLRVDF